MRQGRVRREPRNGRKEAKEGYEGRQGREPWKGMKGAKEGYTKGAKEGSHCVSDVRSKSDIRADSS